MEKLKINMEFQENKELEKQMKQAYLACPQAVKYCNDLNIPEEAIDEEITKVYSFVCDLNYCKHCPGVDNCKKKNPLMVSKIIYENGSIDHQLVPCKELMKTITFEKQFVIRDFDDSWLKIKLKEVDPNKGRATALAKYVEFLKNGKNSWIYLMGNKNSGRSYFAAALTVDAASKEKGPIAYLNSPSRIRELNDFAFGKDKEKFAKRLDFYSNVPLLVLDDFGNEYMTDYVRDAIIYPILSARANKRLFTIFTSDFSLKDINVLLSCNNAVGTIKAKQIVNIISTMADKEISLGDLSIY